MAHLLPVRKLAKFMVLLERCWICWNVVRWEKLSWSGVILNIHSRSDEQADELCEDIFLLSFHCSWLWSLFSWFELMHCNKVVAWIITFPCGECQSLEPCLPPAPLGGCSAGRTQTLPLLLCSRCCSHAGRAVPEGFIDTCVMLLTRPTGCRCSGELCSGLAWVNQRGWLVCAAAQPASPTPLWQSPAPFSSWEYCKVFHFHLKCTYCL